MQKEISEQQFWQAYDALPAELQDSIFSEKTAEIIFNACVENGIKDERISKIAKNVGDVLLGLLSPEQLQPTLELDLNLDPQAAENVCQLIYNAIFEPVRSQLSEIYLRGKEIKADNPKAEKSLPKNKPDDNLKKEKSIPVKITATKSSSDSYREPIGNF